MKSTDKIFISIGVGIAVLIVVALIFALGPSKNTYISDDTPEGVMHNYMLALQKEDYDRAYRYLSSDLLGYPKNVAAFTRDVKDSYYFDLDSVTISVDAKEISGDEATVEVRAMRFYQGDVFDSGQRTYEYDFILTKKAGAWRIYDVDTENWWRVDFFLRCWTEAEGCE
jgi:hypothetical protein